ncbi:MAG: PglZ domain-containing protein, partial [Flavobacteriaceae bacterium]|nr:PglZ domain-containing protein [Flavobacteriaceae bacterium]
KVIEKIDNKPLSVYKTFNLRSFKESINAKLNDENIDWYDIATIFGKAIYNTVNTKEFIKLLELIEIVNRKFQLHIQEDYAQIKNSNPIKKPQIVSKILDHIDFNYKKDKVALIVVDGLSFWQYSIIEKKLVGYIKESYTYSWIPSITQLSRQAIFRGSNPLDSYKQNPINESKLWSNYWRKKGFNKFEIEYIHDPINVSCPVGVKRLGVVYKDLDDYMHSSKDYIDLLKLTENWFERSKINETIKKLLVGGFKVILTSDHGNIQAKGWRSLTGKEKLGTNTSGSRSERHIEYSDTKLKDNFLRNNPDLLESILEEEKAIYFKNNLSFSRRENLVTHGGSHFLEVIIPYIVITNEQ